MNNSNQPPVDRAAINRQNARKSTGPRTPEGKQVSRLNAMKHGLCNRTVVSSKADLNAFHDLSRRFVDDLQPKGVIETHLVEILAGASWRLMSARAYEANLLTLGSQTPAATVEAGDPEIDFALATAASYRNQVGVFSALSTERQRVSREFHRALTELRELQAERRELERVQLMEGAQLYQLHQEQQQAAAAAPNRRTRNETATPYDSTKDGFVLTNDQIQSHIVREARKQAARAADLKRSAAAGSASTPLSYDYFAP